MDFDELMERKNVVGYSTELEKKVTGGEQTDVDCYTIFVTEKVPEDQLSAQDVVPKRINGKPTDVVEVGDLQIPTLMEIPMGLTDKYRPAPGGVSCGHIEVTAGTHGVYVPTTSGKMVSLSNNHVFAAENNARIGQSLYQPGVYDGGGSKDTELWELLDFEEIKFGGAANKQDSAIGEPIDPTQLKREILEVGLVKAANLEPTKEMQVQKTGRTTEHTRGRISYTSAKVRVRYSSGKTAIFDDQIITGPMADGGDSGSLLVDMDNRAVGLLFAGSNKTTVFNKIEYVINRYNLAFGGGGGYKPTAKIHVTLKSEGGDRGRVLATVEDIYHAPIPEADVSLKSAQNGDMYSQKTNNQGKAAFEDVIIEGYEYKVQKSGYETAQGKITESDFQ